MAVDYDQICEDEVVTFTATTNWANAQGSLTFEISADQTTWSEVTLDGTSWTGEVAGTYYFRVIAQNDCAPDGVISNVVTVVVDPTPYIELDDTEITICNNAQPTEVEFESNYNVVLSSEYDWVTLGDGAIVITPNTSIEPGEYEVTLTTDADVCDNVEETLTITIYSVPVIHFFEADEDLYCVGEDLTVSYSITSYGSGSNDGPDFYALHGDEETAIVFPYNITLADTNLRVKISVTNDCGTVDQIIDINVSAPVELEITGVDSCRDLSIATYVPAPEYTLYGATEVLSEGWMVDRGNGEVEFTADSTLAAGDIAIVYYYVETQCDIYTSNEVIVEAYNDPDVYLEDDYFEMCDNNPIPQPTINYDMLVDYGGATVVSETWTVNGEEIDWTANYDYANYNGATITYTIETTCGTFPFTWTLTVDTLPVPVVLQDTIICHDGTTTLSVTQEFDSYQWYMDGESISNASDQTYTVDASELAAEDAIYTYTVVVTDSKGCVSTTNVNGGYQPIDANAVTVQVTNSPRFIFKYEGVETHYIDGINTVDVNDPASLNNNLVYTWEVYNPCFEEDTLVYVTFDIYHNDTLIDNNRIGDYLTNAAIPNSYNEFWNTSIEFSYEYGSAISHTTSTPLTRYNKAQAGTTNQYDNHFPYTKVYGSATFDDFYLHFLADNVYTQTIRPFRIAGDYKIIYKLYATSNTNTHNYPYYSESIDANEYQNQSRIIGGWNSLVASATQTLLNVDSIMISVVGEDSGNMDVNPPAPAPMTPSYEDNATLNIYPNPTSEEINAEISGITGETTIQIVNLTGSVLSTDKVNIPATGKYLYRSTAKNLAPGVYFMYIINDNATLSKKLVVRR